MLLIAECSGKAKRDQNAEGELYTLKMFFYSLYQQVRYMSDLLIYNSNRLFLVKIKKIGEKRFFLSTMLILVIVRLVPIIAVVLL